ncbi:MAG TPA: long-chain fatty acid--CoA ligase, partial [Microbacteriaceae bacterium]|nr:long-chain fatty acid--CoA ligase [Microbacteriaceae bacterium]
MSGVPGARLEQPFDLLEHWAISTPERPYFVDGTHELSFAQAYEHARKLATALRALGVQEGEVVALELSSALQVLFIPALMQLRAATVIHRESGPVHANWLFSSNRTSSERARRTVPVDGAFLRDVAEHAELRESLPYPSRASLLRLAHSSGSTGTPKAIPLTLEMAHHRALAANELAVPGQPFMSLLDMGTASGFHTYLGGLLRGEAFYNPGNAAHNLALLSRYRVSALKLSPIQLSELLAEAERTGTPLDGLTALYCAGSVVPVALRQRVRSLGGIRLYCLYGSTEAGRCAERELLDDDTANVGQIAEGTELRIVDEAGNDVPAGQSGHVRYRRAHQAVEYFEDPFATEAAFVDGWFLTGDIGHISPRGELILDGRSNEVMNVG